MDADSAFAHGWQLEAFGVNLVQRAANRFDQARADRGGHPAVNHRFLEIDHGRCGGNGIGKSIGRVGKPRVEFLSDVAPLLG